MLEDQLNVQNQRPHSYENQPDETQTNFIQNGMLQIPTEYLSKDLLLKRVNLLVNHMREANNEQLNSQENLLTPSADCLLMKIL